MHIHIVKRRKGRKEPYDNNKVYASCYAACLGAHVEHKKAEDICKKITSEIDQWISTKDTVTSQELFEKTAHAIKEHHEDAAFMYATHRDVS